MGITPDRQAGPREEEELQLEDRTADGPPTINGAIRFYNGDIVGKIASGVISLTAGGSSGITEAQHEVLDTLVHWLSETHYLENVRDGNGKVTNAIAWTDSGKTLKVRELVVTRTAGKVSQIDVIQYNGSGTEIQRMTGVITRSGGKVDHIQWTETVT